MARSDGTARTRRDALEPEAQSGNKRKAVVVLAFLSRQPFEPQHAVTALRPGIKVVTQSGFEIEELQHWPLLEELKLGTLGRTALRPFAFGCQLQAMVVRAGPGACFPGTDVVTVLKPPLQFIDLNRLANAVSRFTSAPIWLQVCKQNGASSRVKVKSDQKLNSMLVGFAVRLVAAATGGPGPEEICTLHPAYSVRPLIWSFAALARPRQVLLM